MSEKKLKEASGEAIQKDIPPPRMAGSTIGAVFGKKTTTRKEQKIPTASKN